MRPYNLFSYVHKGNPISEFIIGINGLLLAIIADIEDELLDIQMKQTSVELCENFKNIFGSKDIFENKVERAIKFLNENNINKNNSPSVFAKLEKALDIHRVSLENINECVNLIQMSELPLKEKQQLIQMFRKAELTTSELDPTKMLNDTAKVLNKLIRTDKAVSAERSYILQELNKIGRKHLERHSLYDGIKGLSSFIQKSTLPEDEKIKLVALFKQSKVKDASLSPNTYKKLLQLMQENGLYYASPSSKGKGYINEDIRILISTAGEYHVLYPEEYIDIMEGLPDRNGNRKGGLLLEAAIRSGERTEYTLSQLRAVAIAKEKVNGIYSNDFISNYLTKLNGLNAVLTEKIIRENEKRGKLMLAREESKETKGKNVPLAQRKYDLYVLTGGNDKERDKSYSELVKLVTLATYTLSGHSGEQYENAKMLVNMREHLKAEVAINSIGTKEPTSGYLIPIVKNKLKDPVSGKSVSVVRTDNYIYFNNDSITEITPSVPMSKPKYNRDPEALKNSLFINYKSGSAEKVFVSEQEYKSISAKVPQIKDIIVDASKNRTVDSVREYIESERSRIENKMKSGYKTEKGEINDKKKYQLLEKIETNLSSQDKKVMLSAVLYGMQLRYMDESVKGHFEKNDAKESSNRNHAKDVSMAREALMRSGEKITNSSIFNSLMGHNLVEKHSFRRKPDELTTIQNNFIYHEISRMEKDGAFDLVAPQLGRDGSLNVNALNEAVKNALLEVRATVKTTDEIEKEVDNQLSLNEYGTTFQATLRRQEASAFEYGSYVIAQAEPNGEAGKYEIDVDGAKKILSYLHDSIDSHIEESNSLIRDAYLGHEYTEDSMDYNEIDYNASIKKLELLDSIRNNRPACVEDILEKESRDRDDMLIR